MSEYIYDDYKVCDRCGTTENLEWGPDPYMEEIHDDNTPVWECATCREQARQDI